MSSVRLILASLIHHWRINLAVACGVAAGTAVLTGALLVGDSMRGSLRDLTLDRLGRIEHALVSEQFFRPELAEELAADPQFREHFAAAVPVILLEASIKWQPDGSQDPVRLNGVNLIACDERFWGLGPGGPQTPPQSRKLVVLNRPLAERLGMEVGPTGIGTPEKPTRVMLHLPNLGTVPSGTLLGQKTETVKGHDLTVSEVIPAEGLGRFGLRPNQQLPLNAYVSLELGKWLFRREVQRRGERVNAILVAGRDDRSETETGSEQVLENLLRPKLVDFGIEVEQTPRRYFNVTTERMLLAPIADELMFEALAEDDVQPALTYLANTIALGERQIPYSTITAVDFTDQEPLGPFLTPEGKPIGPLEEGQIVLNEWAAEDLGARPGDTIRVTYFEPESPHAAMQETTKPLELAATCALSGAADDEHFTPSVPGVTDKDSMGDWDAPFEPFDPDRIRSPDHPGPGNDEDYWDKHGTTPKAFVSLATGRALWEGRFGRTTSLRVPPAEGRSVESIERKLEEKLAPHAAALGFVFQPVKRQGLEASIGATSFSQLFLGFSFFIIAAAVMLVALLFRLGIDGRANQVGILLAVGFRRRKVARLLAAEGLLIAGLGGLVGIGLGVGFAALMLIGLTSKHWWLAAVGTPFLRFHAAPRSVLVGYLCGVLAALAAIVWAVGRTRGTVARQLLAGWIGAESVSRQSRPRLGRWIGWAMIAGAVLFGLLAMRIGEEMRAGAFFGAGAMVLIASLALTWTRLRIGAVGSAVAVGRGNLTRMAVRNLARNPGRSTLTIGLVASASFLIASVSAFRMDPTGQTPRRNSGNGGFALVAESDQPIYQDLNTEEGRDELGFSPADSRLFEGTEVYSLRGRPGEDASCLNLYKPREPRLLGVPGELIQRGGFVFKRWVRISQKMEVVNPWLVLERDLGRDADGVPLVPVALDAATATYALHLSKGDPTLDIRTDRGQTVRLRVVGVLPGSIFQGDLLVPEKALLQHFPNTSGYRFFLVEAESERTEDLRRALDNTLGDYGLRTETTGQRLARFLVVQNTYLGTFQSLGGLGLLLGTFGLAAVQLRNVLERRGELALMRATGFGRRALAWLVMIENGLLLTAGLACGVLAALVAVLPHLVSGGASIPWGSLTATLLLVLAVGLIASLGAVRAVLAAPLLSALRGE
jgi:ABC-type lipoprotein release transport system permease subunit